MQGCLEGLLKDKALIDDFIEKISKSRVSYILRTKHPYQKALEFLRGSEDEATRIAIQRHRFYFEIKTNKVIHNDGI